MGAHSPITRLHDWVCGENQVFQWEVMQDDDLTPENITGWTVQWRLSLAEGSPSVLLKPGIFVDASHGVVEARVLAVDTITMDPFKYWYELWRTDANAEDRLAHGGAVLKARIG